MLIEYAVRHILLDDATVSGLIGTRLTPGQRPQGGTMPCATYARMSHSRMCEIPYGSPLIQVTAWDDTYGGARELATAIIDALDRYRGITHGQRITRAKLENDLDLIDPETGLHTVPIDFRVTGKEE